MDTCVGLSGINDADQVILFCNIPRESDSDPVNGPCWVTCLPWSWQRNSHGYSLAFYISYFSATDKKHDHRNLWKRGFIWLKVTVGWEPLVAGRHADMVARRSKLRETTSSTTILKQRDQTGRGARLWTLKVHLQGPTSHSYSRTIS